MAGVGPNDCWLFVEYHRYNLVTNPWKHDFVDRHTSKPLFLNVFFVFSFEIFGPFMMKMLDMAQEPPKMVQDGSSQEPTVVWTHACHQKVASGTQNHQQTTKVNTAKVWFGRVPVDKIALPMFLDNKQQCGLDPRLPRKC